MRTFFCYLFADFHKTKRLPFQLAHLLIPAGTSVVFLIYYRYSGWNADAKVTAYYQVLGMGLPLLTGVFCAMLAEQELSAGGFQNMLSVPKRQAAFFSKLSLLLLFGTAAVLLASVLFGTGYCFGMEWCFAAYSLYWKAAFVMMGGSVFSYILHLFLAFRFNKGVTIALGFAESLLSALLLTGMGEGIWMYVPAAWASRFVTLFFATGGRYDTGKAGAFADLDAAVSLCMMMTFAGLFSFGVWAGFWDGRSGNE